VVPIDFDESLYYCCNSFVCCGIDIIILYKCNAIVVVSFLVVGGGVKIGES